MTVVCCSALLASAKVQAILEFDPATWRTAVDPIDLYQQLPLIVTPSAKTPTHRGSPIADDAATGGGGGGGGGGSNDGDDDHAELLANNGSLVAVVGVGSQSDDRFRVGATVILRHTTCVSKGYALLASP